MYRLKSLDGAPVVW